MSSIPVNLDELPNPNPSQEDVTNDESYEKYLYPTYEDKDFNKKIFQKKEFNDLVVEKSEVISSEEDFNNKRIAAASSDDDKLFKLSNYQRFVRNYLSFQTPYNSLLLYHGLGTGKTCSAILIAEEMRQYIRLLGMPTKKSIYVVSNDNVQKNFMAQLFNKDKIVFVDNKLTMSTCVGDKIIKEFFEHIKSPNYYEKEGDEQRDDVKNKFTAYYENNIKPAYHLINYGKIPNDNYKLYANKLFIIDEVHNIKDKGNVAKETTKKPMIGNKYTIIVKNNDGGQELHYPDSELLKINKTRSTYTFSTAQGETKEVNIDDIVLPIPDSRSSRLTKLIQNVDNLKLLFLSATPMFDNYLEIVTILNFMRMNDNRYLIKRNIQAEELENSISEYARGYVSFVPGGNPYTFPFRLYPDQFCMENSSKNSHYGNSVTSVNLDMYMVEMKEPQHKIYKLLDDKVKNNENNSANALVLDYIDVHDREDVSDSIMDNDDENKRIGVQNFADLISSLIITYPSNDSSESGLSTVMRSIEKKKNKYNLREYEFKENKYNNFFDNDSLKNHACKLAAVINQVENTTGIVLVYSQYITGALIPLALALETRGYIRTTDGENTVPLLYNNKTKEKTKKPKYALITGEEDYTYKNDKAALMERIKSEQNRTGQNIKIVLISSAASEGIDFKNIRQVHILNPWYNMSRIEQIIGRAVRTNSHKDLPPEERNVEIYMHCAYYKDKVNEKENGVEDTEDLHVYRNAFQKSQQIGRISRKLKESSVDCIINYDENDILEKGNITVKQSPVSSNVEIDVEVKNLPYSMNCDYMEKCEPIKCETKIDNRDNVDESTFNESFILMNNDEIISKIKDLFLHRTYYEKDKLYSEIRSIFNYSGAQIDVSLSEVIDNKYKYLIYNKAAEEHGYIVNIGSYYMFQPAVLTYPKIGAFERRSKIPSSKLYIGKDTIDNSRLYVDIKELCEVYKENVIRQLLNLKTNTNLKTGSENDFINAIIEEYNSPRDTPVKNNLDLLLQLMKLKNKINNVKDNLSKLKSEEEDYEEDESSVLAKRNTKKKKEKSNNKKKKQWRPNTYYEYVERAITDEKDETKKENMKKTIIQHYIDSLSFESQLGLLKCWCFAINNEYWINNVFTFNENDDLRSYFEYIKEYIKFNIVDTPDTDNKYLVLREKGSKQDKKSKGKKEDNLTKVYILYDQSNTFVPFDRTDGDDIKVIENIAKVDSLINDYNFISFYAYRNQDNQKIFKIRKRSSDKKLYPGQYCGTGTSIDDYLNQNNEGEEVSRDSKNKKDSNSKKCFQIEYNARMNRLLTDNNNNFNKSKQPTILYFSEYARYFSEIAS